MSEKINIFEKRLLDKFIIQNNIDIEKIEQALKEIMEYKGAIAVSFMDWRSEIILSAISHNDFTIRTASINNMKTPNTILKTIKELDTRHDMEDVVVLYENQIHITRTVHLSQERDFLIYVIFNTEETNLVLVQSKIQKVIHQLTL